MIKTLHIDIEGGWGGSSRSLYELVSRLNRQKISPVIAHRSKGPIQKKYAELGINTVHIPEIYSYAPRLQKSLKIFIGSIPRLIKIFTAVKKIEQICDEEGIDLIHLNYEGLFLMAWLLKLRLNLPMVCHSRTHIPKNIFGKIVVLFLSKFVDHMFFISDNEVNRFKLLAGKSRNTGELLWNIATKIEGAPNFESNHIIYLGNISLDKGPDRLIPVARELKNRESSLKIFVYGADRSGKGFDEELRNRIRTEGLETHIELMGHTSRPQDELVKSFALLRPSRSNDPWGRDVIEASTFGLPVIAAGKYEGVIQNNFNGLLTLTFKGDEVADFLERLKSDEVLWQKFSRNGIQQGHEKFSGKNQVKQFSAVIERLTSKHW